MSRPLKRGVFMLNDIRWHGRVQSLPPPTLFSLSALIGHPYREAESRILTRRDLPLWLVCFYHRCLSCTGVWPRGLYRWKKTSHIDRRFKEHFFLLTYFHKKKIITVSNDYDINKKRAKQLFMSAPCMCVCIHSYFHQLPSGSIRFYQVPSAVREALRNTKRGHSYVWCNRILNHTADIIL